MFKRIPLLSALLILFSVGLYGNDITERLDPKMLPLRTNSEGTLRMIRLLENRIEQSPGTYENHWLLSLAYYYYGDFYNKDHEERKAWFLKCRDQATIAVKLKPDGIDGYYWMGVGYAMWAGENGLIESVMNVDRIISSMNRVIELDPAYFDGMPWAIRAKVYSAMPGFGNREKSESDMKMALKYGKDFRSVYQLCADTLISEGRYSDAMPLVQHGLSLPFDTSADVEDKAALKFLSNYLVVIRQKASR